VEPGTVPTQAICTNGPAADGAVEIVYPDTLDDVLADQDRLTGLVCATATPAQIKLKSDTVFFIRLQYTRRNRSNVTAMTATA
jgi:hypothetical protein